MTQDTGKEFGFTEPLPPDLTGEVTIVSAGEAQLAELEQIRAAREVHGVIEVTVLKEGDAQVLDTTVGEYVLDTSTGHHDVTMSALVGLEQAVRHPQATTMTLEALSTLDPTVVKHAAETELDTGTPVTVVESVLGAIPEASASEAIDSGSHLQPMRATSSRAQLWTFPAGRDREPLYLVGSGAEARLSREHVRVSHGSIKQTLAKYEDDIPQRVEYIAACMRSDAEGPAKAFDARALCELTKAIPREWIPMVVSGEHAKEFATLVDLMSATEINYKHGMLGAHMKALRMLELMEDSAPLEWRRKLRAGEPLSEAASNYADKQYLAQAVLINARIDTDDKVKTHLLAKEKAEAADKYNSIAIQTIGHVLDIGNNPQLEPLAAGFIFGDVREYGFSGKLPGASSGVANRTGHLAILEFLTNVDEVGIEAISTLHQELGIVNLDAYRARTLNAMLDILSLSRKRGECYCVRSRWRP